MLRTKPMVHMTVVAPKKVMKPVVEELERLHLVHLEDFKDLPMGEPFEEAGTLSDHLVKVRTSMKGLKLTPPEGTKVPEDEIEKDLDSIVKEIEVRVVKVHEEVTRLEAQRREYLKKIDELRCLEHFPLSLEDYRGYRTLSVFVGSVEHIPRIDVRHEMFYEKYGRGYFLALFVEKENSDEVAEALVKAGFREFKVPEGSGTPSEMIRSYSGQIEEIDKRLKDLQAELEKNSRRYRDVIFAAEEYLTARVEVAEAPLRFGVSRHAFAFRGWMPKERADYVKERIMKAARGMAYIEFGDGDEPPPVAYDNPKVFRAFQLFTDLMGRPDPREVDPTMVLALGLPVFFGFMLGDIGYGLVILAMLYSGLMDRILDYLGFTGSKPSIKKVLKISSYTTLIFGFLFNEFFGFELFATSHASGEIVVVLPGVHYPEFELFGTHFPYLRLENVMPSIALSLWIGIFHMTLGYVFGFVNVQRTHGVKHAVLEKGSWLMVLWGGVIMLYPVTRSWFGHEMNMAMVWTGLAILIAGMLIAVKAEGAAGILHLPSLFSNVVSYARLVSVGLASVGLAFAFNAMALDMAEGGGALGYLIAGLVLAAGHTLNTVLGIMEPTIQGLRLHYVEQFMKFYDGMGRYYIPFGVERRYTA